MLTTRPGNTYSATSVEFTAFDPITSHPGQNNSRTINGTRLRVVGRGETINASSAPSPRIPTVNPLAARVPSLPRRTYIPTVGKVPTE